MGLWGYSQRPSVTLPYRAQKVLRSKGMKVGLGALGA
jgi:hypothetical protein